MMRALEERIPYKKYPGRDESLMGGESEKNWYEYGIRRGRKEIRGAKFYTNLAKE